jgi:hypothetical protein
VEEVQLQSASMDAANAGGGNASVASAFAGQKLIRNGDLRIQVSSVRRAMQAADSIGKARGAYLADSRASQDVVGRQEAYLLFRVPADKFSEMVTALKTLGDVKNESVNAQDITREYADLEIRLAVKQEMVTRLRTLLANRTAKLSDVLEVERELARAVAELEQLKGEKRYWDQQVALSSLTLTLFEEAAPNSVQFVEPVAAALRGSLELLGRSIAGVVSFVAFALPWTALALFAWWVFKRSGNRWRFPWPRKPEPPTA